MKKLQSITEVLSIKILFILTLFGILSFLTMEFVLKIPPCTLCNMQRIPYYISALICVLFFLRLINGKISILLVLLCFVSAFFIAGFHLLVEEKIIGFACQKALNSQTIEELKNEIYNASPSCSIKIRVFGIRVVLFCLLYNLFVIIIYLKLYKKT